MKVSVTSCDAADINDLHRWLRGSLDAASGVEVTARGSDNTTMGWDVVDVILTHALAISNLAVAFAAYRAGRSRSQPMTITRPDGKKLTVDGPPALVEETINRFLTDGDADRN